MKQRVKIELLDDETIIKVYTIRFIDEEQSETTKFLSNYADHPEIGIFLSLLEIIQSEGAEETFFRKEHTNTCDKLYAMVKDDEDGEEYKGNLRLYCLNYGGNKLIFGNGSIKTTKKLKQDENLRLIAKDLEQIHSVIGTKITTGEIKLDGIEELIVEIEI